MKKLLVCLVAVSLLVSCTPKDNFNLKESNSKIINWALSGEIEELDPSLNNYSRSANVMQHVFAGLFYMDETSTPQKHLCQDYTVSEDGTVYVITLKPDLKWSDGSELTAHDFEYAVKRVANPELASKGVASAFFVKNLEKAFNGQVPIDEVGIKALDDNTLEIQLEGPTPYFISVLTDTVFYPLKKSAVEGSEGWTKSPETYITNGAFMPQTMNTLEYKFISNPYYVNADEIQIDGINVVIMDSNEARLSAYQKGEIDVVDGLNTEAIEMYKDSEDIHESLRMNLSYFDLNCTGNNPVLEDVRVRKALAMSINRDIIITNILNQSHKPAFGIIPHGIYNVSDTSKQFRDTVGDLFYEDVDQARELLAEAGYPNGEGFPKLEFYTMNNSSNLDVAQAVQSMWKENLGIECEITSFDDKAYWNEEDKQEFDVFSDGWSSSISDPYGIYQTFIWAAQERQTGWRNQEFEDLIYEASQTADQSIRMANFIRCEEIMIEEMPIIPMHFVIDKYLCNPKISGVTKNSSGKIDLQYAKIN